MQNFNNNNTETQINDKKAVLMERTLKHMVKALRVKIMTENAETLDEYIEAWEAQLDLFKELRELNALKAEISANDDVEEAA